ncbi:MAG: helix-turn-helix domain-containing protein [Sedimentisphaeraceae bacterium JB056]
MKISSNNTDQTILHELGKRLAHMRIKSGITQSQASKISGIGKRTIERIEAGNDTQLSTLIRLLRALGLAENLGVLVPEIKPASKELLKTKIAQQPQRASSKKKKKTTKWKWGDEK